MTTKVMAVGAIMPLTLVSTFTIMVGTTGAGVVPVLVGDGTTHGYGTVVLAGAADLIEVGPADGTVGTTGAGAVALVGEVSATVALV